MTLFINFVFDEKNDDGSQHAVGLRKDFFLVKKII